MDPLERLAEKNKKHSELLKNDQKSYLKMLPFMFVGLFTYFGVIALVIDFNGVVKPSELTEMTQQVWLLSMMLTFGVSVLCVANSFVYAVYLEALAKELGAKVKTFNVVSSCMRRLLVGAAFFFAGVWLDNIITTNKTEIARYMRFGFDYTPGIIEMISNGLIILVGLIISFAFIGMFSLPKLARKHAEEIKNEGLV